MDLNSNIVDFGADSDDEIAEDLSSSLTLFLERALTMLERSCPERKEYFGSTPLHIALITTKSITIAQKLIENGADINAPNERNWTVLHYAVFHNDLESVCLLLNYGADVRIKSTSGVTPLMLAFAKKNDEIMTILLSYYYEFDNINLTNIILEYDYNINNCEDILLITLSLCNGYSEPYKLIWSRIDIRKFPMWPCNDFLNKFLHRSKFTLSEWFNSLYLIFEPSNIGYLFEEKWFLLELLELLSAKGFYDTHRMDLLYMLLNIGINIDLEDINRIYKNLGFNQELEALIYAGNYNWVEPESDKYILLYFMLSFKEECNTENVYKYFYKHLQYSDNILNDLIPWFKYFYLPSDLKTNLVNSFSWYSGEQKAKARNQLLISLCEVPHLPSLLEICRLAVQNLIKQTQNIKKPYQFHDAVKKLYLPVYLKDILLFKKPIYC